MKTVADKTVVVTGANGVIGSGAARAFLKVGAKVVALVRSNEARAQALKRIGDSDEMKKNLTFHVGDYTSEEGVGDAVKAAGSSVDFVVCSIGKWWRGGPPSTTSATELESVLSSQVVAHHVIAKAFLPLMKDNVDSMFLFVSGGAGGAVWDVQSAFTSVGHAALFGLSMAYRAEFRSSPVRINELRISAQVKLPDDVATGSAELNNFEVGAHIVNIAMQENVADKVILLQHKEHLKLIFVAEQQL